MKLSVLTAALIACTFSIGACSDNTNQADGDGDGDGFDIDECLMVGDGPLEPGFYITDREDLDAFPDDEPFCTESRITIQDEDGDVGDLEPLSQMQSAGIVTIGFGENCEYEDPYCTEPAAVNENIGTLRGLRSLRRATVLEIGLASIDNLDGLQRLERLGSLYLIGLQDDGKSLELNSLEGLDSLRVVESDFELSEMQHLVDLDGLSSLRTVGGDLTIGLNDELRDLSALHQLESVGGRVSIFSNRRLPQCQAERLIDEIGRDNIGGEVSIEYNQGDGDC